MVNQTLNDERKQLQKFLSGLTDDPKYQECIRRHIITGDLDYPINQKELEMKNG